MSLTNPMKVLITSVVVAIIGLGFWMLDWQGKQQTLRQTADTLKGKIDEREGLKHDLRGIDKLMQDNITLKSALKDAVQAGIEPENPQQFVANYITQCCDLIARVKREDGDNTFALQGLTPGTTSNVTPTPAARKEEKTDKSSEAPEALRQYPTRTFAMQMTGRYETVVDFLDRLGHLQMRRLVTVNRITLSPQTDVTRGGSPTLGIQIPLTAYLGTGP